MPHCFNLKSRLHQPWTHSLARHRLTTRPIGHSNWTRLWQLLSIVAQIIAHKGLQSGYSVVRLVIPFWKKQKGNRCTCRPSARQCGQPGAGKLDKLARLGSVWRLTRRKRCSPITRGIVKFHMQNLGRGWLTQSKPHE